jgi:hypothetical protein
VDGVSHIRSSERIRAQLNANATQLERAMKIADNRYLGNHEGTINASCFLIASFDNGLIHSRAAKLGVSLGSSTSEIDSSIGLIKDLDLNRTMTMF